MAQTQRRPVPRTDSGELDTALAFLDFNRESVLKKTDGLDEEQRGHADILREQIDGVTGR
jgi:hypothetical protein